MTNGGDSKKLRIPRIGSLPQATVVANSYRDPYPCVFCSSYRIFSMWLPSGCLLSHYSFLAVNLSTHEPRGPRVILRMTASNSPLSIQMPPHSRHRSKLNPRKM